VHIRKQGRDELEHERVDHQQEESERHEGDRQREDDDQRAHDGVHEAEQSSGEQQRRDVGDLDAGQDLLGHPEPERHDQPADHESGHFLSFSAG
jgi:hypothetical protein